MFYISEKEYASKLEKIKKRNESKKRLYQLKIEKEKYKQRNKMQTSNKVLMSAIIAVILFSIACLYIQYSTSIEVSSTLITLWYSFWTVEIVSLAGIKMTKVIKNYNPTKDIGELNIDNEESVG